MVCEFGMSPMGPIAFRGPGAPWDEDRGSGFSEATARRVDEEIHRFVMRGYETAHTLLTTHRAALVRLAEELLQVESLDAEAVRALLRDDSNLHIAACAADVEL
jgi:cell division protease FtsH